MQHGVSKLMEGRVCNFKLQINKTFVPIYTFFVDPGGPMVITHSSGSEVRGFDPGRGLWNFSERKNPEYDFLRKGSKAVGHVS